MKVLVTGASGFFGPHVVKALHNYEVIGVGKSDYDLLDIAQCEQMFKDYKPDCVVHLAALTGGILKNKSYPADMWFSNMLINPPILKFCVQYKVQKIIYIMPGCAYPKDCGYSEDELWDGYPDIHPAPFSLSRKMGMVGCEAFKKQYGLDYSIVIPGNMYGEHDCFDVEDCHVIPALIRKLHEADAQIDVWGSGEAIRDFVYAGDVAKCIPYFLEHNEPGPINISSGQDTKIKDLVLLMRKIINGSLTIRWDTDMPEGPSRKVFDVSRMQSLGLSCPTTLEEGLKTTYSWFLENIA